MFQSLYGEQTDRKTSRPVNHVMTTKIKSNVPAPFCVPNSGLFVMMRG